MAYFLRLTSGPESVRYRRVPSVWVLELVSNAKGSAGSDTWL